MVQWGYTMMGEQSDPRALVSDAVAAEAAGFDFAVISDHYFPWLEEMGHSPYTWSVLGAVAWATERLPLMTYVTCPTFRYHPVVVAQKAATIQLLSQGRFTLGLGAGENLNEHVVGIPWPSADVRHERLVEAVEIIRALFDGGYVNYRGSHFTADSAKLWDLPDTAPPIGIAVSGQRSCEIAGKYADVMIAVEPEPRLREQFEAAGGSGKPCVGQVPVCFDSDRDTAVKRAHELFRWFDGGWKVNAELPGPAGFDAASSHVQLEDVAKQIPCGNDVGEFVEKIKPFSEAGFTHVALVQIGGADQTGFIDWSSETLLPALRKG
ncbi:MAG TPA: TIGR03557 family F420-dependent LLM class oxidoreductase [Mycobacteriales bacterium]|jgi:G6PDH family F420-dependent oxidoreductase|nr:TIGR03557 family F420-dependent LLM class oxidoreductase [Mycobacteriales bacterium]